MLTPQFWQMGFGHLSLRESAGGGHGWSLVEMQLEPPVQAAGENHSAGLPGGENRGEEGSGPHWAASHAERTPGDLDKGQIPTQEVWVGA